MKYLFLVGRTYKKMSPFLLFLSRHVYFKDMFNEALLVSCFIIHVIASNVKIFGKNIKCLITVKNVFRNFGSILDVILNVYHFQNDKQSNLIWFGDVLV